MKAVVCIVGKSNVGKTTFLEKLVPELKRRGYRVAVIKHDAHDFQIDRPGKDTWRLAQAGTDLVLISSPKKMALIELVAEERSLNFLASLVESRVDIILAEGYKRSDKPKIEISRSELGSELLCSEDELMAIVSDRQFPFAVPHFDLDNSAGVADLLTPLIEQSQ